MKTIEDLIEEYTTWTLQQGHPQLSADELLHELLAQRDKLQADIDWLYSFITQWENAQ